MCFRALLTRLAYVRGGLTFASVLTEALTPLPQHRRRQGERRCLPHQQCVCEMQPSLRDKGFDEFGDAVGFVLPARLNKGKQRLGEALGV